MARVTSETTQKAHRNETAEAGGVAPGPTPLAILPLGDADAAVCIDGVCRLPQD